MIELKKGEIEGVLHQISYYKKAEDGVITLISGLMKENLPLKDKRKLQKIQKKLIESLTEASKEELEIREKSLPEEEFKKEMLILLDEVVKIDLDKISLSAVEDITSTTVYNFDLIEKIAE